MRILNFPTRGIVKISKTIEIQKASSPQPSPPGEARGPEAVRAKRRALPIPELDLKFRTAPKRSPLLHLMEKRAGERRFFPLPVGALVCPSVSEWLQPNNAQTRKSDIYAPVGKPTRNQASPETMLGEQIY